MMLLSKSDEQIDIKFVYLAREANGGGEVADGPWRVVLDSRRGAEFWRTFSSRNGGSAAPIVADWISYGRGTSEFKASS